MMMKHLRSFLLLVLSLCGFFGSSAQTFCPSNINFENGNLNLWKFYTASNNGSSGISTLTNVSAISGRHTLTSGTATDYYGGFPIVDPVGGSYSLKLGNDQVGAQVDQARYTFTIPANVNNYSLIYRYAVVLENPSHNSSEQPFFRVRVYDSTTGNIINCASFLYVSQSSLPGFSTSSQNGNHTQGAVVYYKPWSTASLNLSGQAGKTLVVEFTAADCSLGAHMGYGYVDVSCGLFAITGTTCNATSPLTAPPGFQSYTWYNSNYSTVLGTGQTITIATPTVLSQYHVVLTPYPGYGCQDTLHTQLIGSTLALAQMPDTMLCNNASVTLNPTVTGNVPPFTYTWTPAAGLSCTTCASPVASPTTTTNYVLTVKDSFGCIRRDTVTVKAKVAVATTTTNAPCFGLPGGSATATASTGTAPYTYTWNTTPPQTTAAATALLAGSYTVTVTDTLGCIASKTISVTSPTKVVAAITSKDSVSCYGGVDGQATATASGGTSPYTYSWNTTPAKTGTVATGLSAGTRIVTVTDANGCIDTESVAILQPQPLALAIGKTAVLCKGDTTGSATITGSGGTAPYTYAVDTRSYGSSSTITGLAAGTHVLHLKDAHGCIQDSTISITEPAKLTLGYVTTQPLCFGNANGAITISASGSTSPYQYAVGTGSFSSTATYSSLAAGTYVLHAKDANGCQKDSTITLSQPTPVVLAPVTSSVLCFGTATGGVTATAAGGTSPYTFAIDAGLFGSVSAFSGLSAGTHTVHVKDANGCQKDSTITIAQPATLKIGYTATKPLCNGAANGTITITGSGGTTPYQYALNSGAFGASGAFTGLTAGTYVLHIKDANDCAKDSIITLSQPTVVSATTSKTNVSCNGGTNGAAQVVASGGTTPYTYSWTGISQTTASVSNLAAGSYTVTVTDANGCSFPATVSITQPTALAAATTALAPVCNNTATGSGSVSISGGTSPYTYSWNTTPVRTTASASSLNSGSYVVTVTDGAGCTTTATVTIPVTPPIVVSVSSTSVSCFGGKDGTATAAVFNGNSPYTYVWNTTPAQTAATATGLSATNYTVTVTGANGCVGIGTVAVQEPAVLDAKISARATCPGFAQGTLSATISGGTSAYTYEWNTSPVKTTASITGLPTGTYILKVTDSKGCIDTVSETIKLFTPPIVDAGPDQELCVGSSAQLSGSGAQSYLWSPSGTLSCADCASPIASPTKDTTYTLIGTDVNGCKDTDAVRIVVIQHVPVSVEAKHTICEGDSVRLGAAGGIAWQWLLPVPATGSSNTRPFVRPATTTSYQIVITENQCFKDTLTQEVEVLPMPSVDLGPDLEAPNGTTIQLNATVANANTIEWSPATGLSCTDCYTPQFVLHGKTMYIAKVANVLGCAALDTIVIRDICDEHYFFFANVFTPNGDGANDRFYPQGVGTFPVQHFMIYDRWGEIVFSAANISVNDAAAGWDGSFKGQQLKPDVYVYVMDAQCENGNKVVIRGDVTLIR